MVETPASKNLVTTFPEEIEKKPIPWKRLLTGTLLVGLGGTAVAMGIALIGYRLRHVVVEQALINGRTVRLRSPIDGKITAFYARPGVSVKSGQVLGRIGRSPDGEQKLLQLQGEVQANSEQLAAASQSLTFLQNHLQNLENRNDDVGDVDVEISLVEVKSRQAVLSGAIAKATAARANYQRYQQLLDEGVGVAIANESVTKNQAAIDAATAKALAAKANYQRYKQLLDKGVDVAIAFSSVTKNQAAVDAATAKALAAKANYQRYQQLLAEGAVSAQQIDQLKSEWVSTEAEVRQARSALDVARMILNAIIDGVAIGDGGTAVSIQQIEQLKSEWETAEAEVRQTRSALDVAQITLNTVKDGVAIGDGGAGGVSIQQIERLKSEWEIAEAEVKQAREALVSAQTALDASKNGVASNQTATTASLLAQRTNLMQAIQSQSIVVNTLKSQVESGQKRLDQMKSLYSDRQDLEILAPFPGIVYSTDREQGEQITQFDNLITLLDCNELWVEAALSANDVSRIDTQKPVSVQLTGYNDTFAGEVDVIQPISGFPVSSSQGVQEKLQPIQAQALLPSVSTNLVGQPLARVTVRIPPPPQYNQSQQFCGIGQLTRLTFPKKTLSILNFRF